MLIESSGETPESCRIGCPTQSRIGSFSGLVYRQSKLSWTDLWGGLTYSRALGPIRFAYFGFQFRSIYLVYGLNALVELLKKINPSKLPLIQRYVNFLA